MHKRGVKEPHKGGVEGGTHGRSRRGTQESNQEFVQ